MASKTHATIWGSNDATTTSHSDGTQPVSRNLWLEDLVTTTAMDPTAVTWERVRVEASDGVSLAVFTAAPPGRAGDDAPPVLLLHGFPDTHAMWRHQVPRLLENGYRVIAPDLRGFGASGKPRSASAYRMKQVVDDLDRVLAAAHAGEEVAVIGHDWGAVAAWAYAGHRPRRTRALVAISVGHPKAFIRAWRTQFPRSWYAIAFQVPGLAELVFTAADRKVFKMLFGASPDWPDYEERLSEDGALTAGFNWYRANGRPHVLADDDRYPRIEAPTLGILGTKEVMLTREQMERSGDLVDADWTFVEVRGGHWIPLTRATEVAGAIHDFFGRAYPAPVARGSR